MKFTIKILSLFLLCFMAGFSVFGQGTFVWEKQVPIPFLQYFNKSVQSHSKKFWVGVGSATTLLPSGTGCCGPNVATIVAYKDSTGDTLWTRTVWDLYPAIASYASGVVRAPNNNFWVILNFDWAFIQGQGTASGICVLEIDSLGQVLTTREFLRDCNFITMRNISSLPDGGFIMAGTLSRYTGCQTNSEMFAIRLNGDGETVWQNIYAIEGNQSLASGGIYPNNLYAISYGNSIAPFTRIALIDVNSGIIVQNITQSNGQIFYSLRNGGFMFGGGTLLPNNTYVSKFGFMDAHFNMLWERIDTSLYSATGPILETKDSCVIMRAKKKQAFNTYQEGLLKVNYITGAEVWRRMWPHSVWPVLNHTINGIALASNGDVMVSGSKSSYSGDGDDYYMAKLTGVADFVQPSDYCSDSVRANFTGTWLQDTLRLHSTSNSGMVYQDSLDYQWIINGVTVSLDSAFQQIKNSVDYPQGLPVSLVITNFWGCKDTLTAKVTPQGIVGNKPNIGGGAYLQNPRPNPSTQNVTIGYKLPANTKEAVLRVYELGTGRTVAERNLSALEADTQFNVSHWATGVYAYQLFVNGSPVAVKQLVVTR